MPDYSIIYDARMIEHLARNGITIEEFTEIVRSPVRTSFSRSTGRDMAFGYALDGRYIACVYEVIDDLTIVVVTAYEIEP